MYNNAHLNRIEELNRSIVKIRGIQKKEEYIGAGITLSITVGLLHENSDPDLTMEVSDPETMKQLLYTLWQELESTKKIYRGLAHKECLEIQDYFKTH